MARFLAESIVWSLFSACLSKIIHFRCNFSVKNKPSILGSPIMIHSIYDILCNMKIEYVYINTYLYMCKPVFTGFPANHKSKPFSQKNPSPFKNILTRKLPTTTSYPLQDLGSRKLPFWTLRTKSQTFFHLIAASSWRFFVFLDRFVGESQMEGVEGGKVLWFVGSLVGSPSPKRLSESLSVPKILHHLGW